MNQLRRRVTMKTHFVAFVDILGFAGAVEALDGPAFGDVVDYWAKRIRPVLTALRTYSQTPFRRYRLHFLPARAASCFSPDPSRQDRNP